MANTPAAVLTAGTFGTLTTQLQRVAVVTSLHFPQEPCNYNLAVHLRANPPDNVAR